MTDLFSGIQNFIVVVFTVVTTTVTAFLPSDKQIPFPTSTPVIEIQQGSATTPIASPKEKNGNNERESEPKSLKKTATPSPSVSPVITASPATSPIPTSTPSPTITPKLSPTPSPSITSLPSPKPTPVYIVSNADWKFSLTPYNWLDTSFDDSSWTNTQAPSDGQCPASAIAGWSWILDNGTLPMSISSPNWANKSGYFRKTFDLTFIPSSSSLKTLFDDDGDIYINGHLVFSDHDGRVNRDASDNGIRTATIDPSVFIEGQNVINLAAVDSAGGCQSVQVHVEINP